MQCVFIYGPVASGKLTVARELAALTGFRLFHNHFAVDAALALFDFGTPGFVKLREATWFAAFREAVANDQSFVFTFHPEASVPETFVEEAKQILESSGGRVVFVELTCAEDVIESRLTSASRAEFRKLDSVELYRTLRDAGAFRYDALPSPALSLPSDELTPQKAARRILDALEGSPLS
jgi:hypothetical protein